MAQSIAKKPRTARLGAELFSPVAAAQTWILGPRLRIWSGALGKSRGADVDGHVGVLKPFSQLKLCHSLPRFFEQGEEDGHPTQPSPMKFLGLP